MSWVEASLLMAIAAAVPASATLAVVYRKKIIEKLFGRRVVTPAFVKRAVAQPRVASVAIRPWSSTSSLMQSDGPLSQARSMSNSSGQSQTQDPSVWERKFKMIHSTISEARKQEILRHTMKNYGLTRADAMRKIVEDRYREDGARF
jgi:hypothetical protein